MEKGFQGLSSGVGRESGTGDCSGSGERCTQISIQTYSDTCIHRDTHGHMHIHAYIMTCSDTHT